jgi:hypothetical protein
MGKKRRLWINLGIMLVIIGLVGIQTQAHGNSWNWKFFFSDESAIFFTILIPFLGRQKISLEFGGKKSSIRKKY